MEVKLQSNGRQLIAALRGEIDHHSAIRLREEIDRAITGRSVEELILDFSEISFMDSSGIGLILGRYKRMHACGGKLTVCGVSDRLLPLMRMAGLDKLHILQTEQTERTNCHETNQ